MFRTLLALLGGLVFSIGAFAQGFNAPIRSQLANVASLAISSNQQTQISGVTPAASTDCAFTFTSGGTATVKYLQYCVTVNGNIVEFQSPLGAEHIRVGTVGDGYSLCDFGAGEVGYHDYAGFGDVDTGTGWAAPVTVSQTATMVKIARSTADGRWTLTQTFTQSASDASVKVHRHRCQQYNFQHTGRHGRVGMGLQRVRDRFRAADFAGSAKLFQQLRSS